MVDLPLSSQFFRGGGGGDELEFQKFKTLLLFFFTPKRFIGEDCQFEVTILHFFCETTS